MVKWEYLIVDDLTIQELSKFGDEGWELVTVVPYSTPRDAMQDTFYLKRKVESFYPPRPGD